MLERVQIPNSKLILTLRKLSYEERLKRLDIFSLRCRKLKGDIIELSKMIHGIDEVNLGKFLCMDKTTRKQFMLKN